MKNSMLSLLVVVLLVSCSSDDNETGDFSTYYFKTESQILVTTENNVAHAYVSNGENLVFKFELIKADNPNIADDEYSEKLIFEIDPLATEFTFNADEILQAKAYFNQFCFCADVGSIPINTGTIQGTKLGHDDWLVDINISFLLNGKLQTRSLKKVFSNIAAFRQSY